MATPAYSQADCELFSKYARQISWSDLPRDDQTSLRELRSRLSETARRAATGYRGFVKVKDFISNLNPNGRSPARYWSCIYPVAVPNKSYGLQIAIIIDANGAEVCFCLGSGDSYQKDPRIRENNAAILAKAKARLVSLPVSIVSSLASNLTDSKWSYRRTWLQPHGSSDFTDLSTWLHYAASPGGNAASISANLSCAELDSDRGRAAVELFEEAVQLFTPVMDFVYAPSDRAEDAISQVVAIPLDRQHQSVDRGEIAISESAVTIEPYTLDDAVRELFIPRERLEEMIAVLQRKKNLILAGPPGVGKTFVARRLAYTLLGEQDPTRMETVQFHQSYAYEDFVQGWRPAGNGFTRKDGVFHEFCVAASRDSRAYVFIIDEINRGNLSKIFGEVMVLIEPDKRGEHHALPLTYSESRGERFYIPRNLYVIGMMNTADRSLAMVDYALRRRFGFVQVEPAFNQPTFKSYLARCGVPDEIIARITRGMARLNEEIAGDRDLGPGFEVGHSYFIPCEEDTPGEEWLRRVLHTEVEPLLGEYWFEDPNRIQQALKHF